MAASIVASIDAMESEGIVENAKMIGEQHLRPRRSRNSADQHLIIGEARGLGVFWALDLVDDQDSRTPVSGGLTAELRSRPSRSGTCCRSPPTTVCTWCRRASSRPTTWPRVIGIIDEALTEIEAASAESGSAEA